jgi:chemotaxis family two-component system sensor kinase Cph1
MAVCSGNAICLVSERPGVSFIDGTLSVAEQARLDECSQEPIRTPGAVQPHGALIAVDADSYEIRFASENCDTILGTSAEQLLGSNIADFVGAKAAAQFRDVIAARGTATNPMALVVNGQRFDTVVHRTQQFVVVEFEPSVVAVGYQSAPAIYAAIRRLAKETTVPGLWSAAARELCALTQFDRVMVYHFHPDGHGEIVAEEAADGMEPYLGLHYPASDIPTQARALYVTKLSRHIVSTVHDGAALISNADSLAVTGLDLSHAELRCVSPVHLQFMRNMGQASTLSLSLVHNEQLIGMITCAHRTSHRIPYILRQGLEILASQVALQLDSMRQIERLTHQMHLRSLRTTLVAQLAGAGDIAGALFNGDLTVLDLIPAAGATMRLGGTVTSIGRIAPEHGVLALVDAIGAKQGTLSFITNALAIDHPDLAGLVPTVAGVLMVPLGGEGDFLAWFRSEITETTNWLGDQRSTNRATPLSPRSSFSSWSQSVTGLAAPWQIMELEAVELARDLDGVMLRRAESKLASVALQDELTGLPNRRYLMDRLEHVLTTHARGDNLALLFIDLDGFKTVNDTLGHDAGDALLVHAAQQILSTTRVQDTVCRIGGDEFVVVCEGATTEEAEVIASRIIDAIRLPAFAGGHNISTTASVGVAAAAFPFTALDILHEADAAMYRAKARGRDQASR